MKKLRVALVFGGRSGEHEVSLLSAASILGALDESRYEVVPIGIAKSGRWLVGHDPLRALSEGRPGDLAPALMLTDPEIRGLAKLDGASHALEVRPALRAERIESFDVVFPVLHGPYGEDGTIQGMLELAGVPYVGAGVAASAVGMDKALMKSAFAAAGLPQVRYRVVLRRDIESDLAAVEAEIASHLPLPVFVKPCNLGSSVGVCKVKRPEELGEALREAAQYDRKVLVEEGVDAREVEVAVLGNDRPEASVPGEVVPGAEFYDYRAKYIDEGSRLLIPAPLGAEVEKEIRDLAGRAFHAIDACGMARVDFFFEDRPGGRLLVNEINTIPGFTRISMYPKLWEASGLPYPALVDRLIELALERHADRARSRVSYTLPPAKLEGR
jgi:D-alanine-D-alanine ligase